MEKDNHIKYFFEPQNIVIIGASRKEGSWGYNIVEKLLKTGFKGRVYLVNPQNEHLLFGLKVYSSLADVPGRVELALICVSVERVLRALKDCVAKGIKAVIIVTSGFSEASSRGKEL